MDGYTTKFSNLLPENMVAQIDDDGCHHVLFDEIVDDRINNKAIKEEETHTSIEGGGKRRRCTTVSWDILIR